MLKTIALIAALATPTASLLTLGQAENTKFPPERMAEIEAMM